MAASLPDAPDWPALDLFQPSDNFAALWTEESPRVLLRGPNRIGKTRHLAALIASRAIDQPGTRWRFVAPTRDFVQTIAGAYLAEFLDGHLHARSYFIAGRGWNGGASKVILLANGSSIQLLSYQDPPEAHEGAELDGAVMDEPPPFAHLMATQTRLMDRPNAQLYIGATMVNKVDSTFRKLIEGDDDSPTEGRTLHTTGWVQYVGKLSAETCPWRTPESIEAHLEILRTSPWDFNQRALGGWEGIAAGRRFTSFSEANIGNEIPDGMAVKVALAIDHGELAMHQHFLIAYHFGTQLWIWDEWTNAEDGTTPEEDVHEVCKLFKSHGIKLRSVDLAVGDINSAGKLAGGRKVNDLLEKAFARKAGTSAPPFRISRPNKRPGMRDWSHRYINYACKRGDLMVHPRCTGLIDTMRNWAGKSRGDSDDAALAHAADALGYLVLKTLGKTNDYAKLRFHF